MNLRRSKRASPETLPPPENIERVEDDPALADHGRRVSLLRERKARIVGAQIELERTHQAFPRDTAPRRLDADELLSRAAALLAAPPTPTAPLPARLPGLLAERALVEKALALGEVEERVVSNAALVRLREAKSGEWREVARNYALAVAQLIRAEAARDELFRRIGWSAYGRMPLDLSEFRVSVARTAPGAPLTEILTAALAAGLVTKEEIA
jgi:hypothetical protein